MVSIIVLRSSNFIHLFESGFELWSDSFRTLVMKNKTLVQTYFRLLDYYYYFHGHFDSTLSARPNGP